MSEAKEKAKKEAARIDMKQHANKLIQGFEKLDGTDAKRAIWELLQNAVDVSENCEIIISITDKSLIFQHNGKPFTTTTLNSLIKQVSSKASQNNDDEVGQYGTGFITTHSFGKKILLSGSLKKEEGYIYFDNFEIDRTAKDSDELIEKLIIQQEKAFDLIDINDTKEEPSKFTTFEYLVATDLEKENVEKVIDELNLALPYVMSLNDKLIKVTIIDKNKKETIFKKNKGYFENTIKVTPILINSIEKIIYSISEAESKIVVILPLENPNKAISFDPKLAKLFLYYPLIGTENFGFNFIVHSKQFAPTEPRDGIHLRSNNDQTQEKEKSNRELLEVAFTLISNFIKENANIIDNIHLLSKINFNTNIPNNSILCVYFKELKEKWVNNFKSYPLVETNGERICPEDAFLFSEELLKDDTYFDSIYTIVNLFWKNEIPQKHIVKEWTKYITEWEDTTLNFIDITSIAEEIEKSETLSFYEETKEDLKNFYTYLIKYNHTEIFNQYKILPNIKNDFCQQSQLKSCLDIDDVLIDIANVIIPDISKKFLAKDFKFELNLDSYERKDFVKDINAKIAENYKSENNFLLASETLSAMIKYCSIFPDTSKGIRADLLSIINDFFGLKQPIINIRNLSDDGSNWWLTALKCLLRNFIYELNKKDNEWIKSNFDFLTKLSESGAYTYSDFKDIISIFKIFPNQQFDLCTGTNLKIDNNISEKLKDLYDEIFKNNSDTSKYPIRNFLIHNDFKDFLPHKEEKTSESLGQEIESLLKIQDNTNINQSPYIKQILEIIKLISDNPEWKKYFPIIESKKASIMLDRISDSETKEDLFSIIGLEKEKISLLGKLSKKDNFEKIIKLGTELLEEEEYKKTDFQFKKTIGTHIEKLVREEIKVDLKTFEVKVQEEQGGQDITIKYKGEIIYYIEVKSRWDSKNSVTMSSTQMKKAVENQTEYSLCCVDMTDYKVGTEERYKVSDINEIRDRIYILSDIGSKIEPILKGILSVKDKENEISISEDYRGVIPQAIIKEGGSLDSFIEMLIKKLAN
ncbi:hypothetical protein CGC50_07455 [Capnocytophaga gingivalis]|jgi:hypothetical protein|uniref:Protein NO VEIN C-terminal domain-containing protein n=1 Tax=Capnocytophaga gingivalis TaxID=1017 RepID=A0A250FPI9_9FLAO|nr:DUF3883 domain-containing protein [Capnocytophaga gingivalis]ATA87003.1 hypothetical protein CGC50_07455 [Capnocytophaga gingivalis]